MTVMEIIWFLDVYTVTYVISQTDLLACLGILCRSDVGPKC